MAQQWKVPFGETVVNIDNLTTSFDDNQIVASVVNTDTLVLYLDYEKGNETEIQIRFEYSDHRNLDNADFYVETILIDPNQGIIQEFCHRLVESGRFRLAVLVSGQENMIRVSFRGEGTLTGGSLAVKYTTNNNRGMFS